MAEQGLAARRKRRRKYTTRPGPGPVAGTGPGQTRTSRAARLNHKWYGDGTEIPTDEGKLHLASVLDMASRRIARVHPRRAPRRRSWPTARWPWRSRSAAAQVPGVIMHTDQGSEGGFNWSSQHLDLEV